MVYGVYLRPTPVHNIYIWPDLRVLVLKQMRAPRFGGFEMSERGVSGGGDARILHRTM